MRLVLDEMISPAVARRLSKGGFDVQSIKGWPTIEGASDEEVLLWAATDRRTLVTFDADFFDLHTRCRQYGHDHFGIIVLDKDRVPRRRADIGVVVEVLDRLLRRHPTDDALLNQLRVLP